MRVHGYLAIIIFVSLLTSSLVIASEIRGSFSGYNKTQIPAGTNILVICDNAKLEDTLKANGSYSV